MPDDAPNPTRTSNTFDDTAPTLTTQQARQGETSGRMRNVLGISLLIAVVLVGGLAYAWNVSRHPANPSMPAATNAQQTAPNAPQPHDQVPGTATPTPPSNNSQGGAQ